MKTVLLAFILQLSWIVSAQHDIGIGIDLGVSKLYSTQSDVGVKYNFSPSGNIGAYYRFKPENSKNNFLIELMISQIEGKLYSDNDITDANFNVIGKQTN